MTAENFAFTELRKIAKGDSLSQCANLLRMVPVDAVDVAIAELPTWTRGGAETYILPFELSFSVAGVSSQSKFLFKACVATLSGKSIDEILSDWVDRRGLLADAGVKVPRLVGRGEGVLLEEFIPLGLRDRVAQSDAEPLLEDLVSINFAVRELGFLPINIANDLRSRGDDVVMVDFGEDLGPAHQRPSGHPTLQECSSFVEQALGKSVDPVRVEKFFRVRLTQRNERK